MVNEVEYFFQRIARNVRQQKLVGRGLLHVVGHHRFEHVTATAKNRLVNFEALFISMTFSKRDSLGHKPFIINK